MCVLFVVCSNVVCVKVKGMESQAVGDSQFAEIVRMLDSLSLDGLVTFSEDEGYRLYEITDAGRELIKPWVSSKESSLVRLNSWTT